VNTIYIFLILAFCTLASVCPNPNPPYHYAQDVSSPDTAAKETSFVDSTGLPPSRTVVWPTIVVNGENTHQQLFTITEPTVTLIISEDNPTGTRKCAVTFQGTLNPTLWSTAASYNGKTGQLIAVRLRNRITGLIQKFDVGQEQVTCGANSFIIDVKTYYDDNFFSDISSAEFVLQPYQWNKCKPGN
jgi:hypothetical protein